MEERLDRRLARMFPALPRSEIEAAIREGRVRVNGRPARKGMKLRPGDAVEAERLKEAADAAAGGWRGEPDLPLEVVYDDGDVVGVNKPPGMPTQPLRWSERGTLVHALLARWPGMAGVGDDPLCPGVLHRLDIGTSGVVLAARRQETWLALRALFAARAVEKRYWAIVEGRAAAGSSDAPLVRQTRTPCRMRALAPGEALPRHADVFPAETSWTPLETGPHYTLLEVLIRSGVTHQIRCHLAAAGHPVAGDVLYGAAPLPAARHFLHAHSISWRLAPASPVRVATAPPPPDFLPLLIS